MPSSVVPAAGQGPTELAPRPRTLPRGGLDQLWILCSFSRQTQTTHRIGVEQHCQYIFVDRSMHSKLFRDTPYPKSTCRSFTKIVLLAMTQNTEGSQTGGENEASKVEFHHLEGGHAENNGETKSKTGVLVEANFAYEELNKEPEIHLRTWLAVAAMLLLNFCTDHCSSRTSRGCKCPRKDCIDHH